MSTRFKSNAHQKVNEKDPTRTLTLRNKFASDASGRLRKLKRDITRLVSGLDVFGLGDSNRVIQAFKSNVQPREFQFLNNPAKIRKFQEWLELQHAKGLLELVNDPFSLIGEEPWSNTYIRSSYQSGVSTARARLNGLGIEEAILPFNTRTLVGGGLAQGFNQPFHADRVALLYQRTFDELEGITAWMDKEMSRQLAGGLVEGIGPAQMARRLNNVIEKTGRSIPPAWTKGPRGITRAKLIARTETTHAFNAAQLNEWDRASETIGEPVLSEWWTALDERVRSSHAGRHGRIYKRAEAEGLIGEPNCRCTLIPYIKSIDTKADRREATLTRRKLQRELKEAS